MSPRRRDDEGEEVSSSPGGRAVGLRRSGLMCSAIKTAAIMSAGFLLDASPSTAAAASQPHSSSRSPALAWVGSPVTTGGVRGRRGEQGTFASTGCSRHGLRRPDALRGIQVRDCWSVAAVLRLCWQNTRYRRCPEVSVRVTRG